MGDPLCGVPSFWRRRHVIDIGSSQHTKNNLCGHLFPFDNLGGPVGEEPVGEFDGGCAAPHTPVPWCRLRPVNLPKLELEEEEEKKEEEEVEEEEEPQ